MEVQSYLFQSPYHTSVQVGRPNPAAEEEESAVESQTLVAASDQKNSSLEQVLKLSQADSVNVAVSLSNSGVSSALAQFSDLNAAVQEQSAYSV
jgi:fatty acid/phospholipid biosynthesis enzyme